MKYLSIALVAVFLSGCAALTAAAQRACATEDRLHADYVSFVAPFRSADRVALEALNYTKIKTACATGDPLQILGSLVAAAKSLRK